MLMSDKIHNLSNIAKNIIAILVCAVMSIIVILPYLHDGSLHCGVDMSFHLNRAYNLSENIRNGNWFPYLDTYSFNQVGSAVNMAYGVLPLYPVALAMLVISNPIHAVYVAMIFFIFISMLISYVMGNKVWHSRQKALVFSFLYVLSAYNFSWMFGTFGLGQTVGYIFVPLIFYGLYSIFCNEKKEWYFLAIGMTGVIYTHILSVLIYASAILLVLIIILFSTKGFFRNFKYFVYACVASLFSTIFYWNNFRELYANDISTTNAGNIASAKLGLGDAIVGSFNGNNGTFGPLLTMLVIVGLIMYNKQTKFAKLTIVVGLVYFLGTTTVLDLFWNFFNNTPLVMLQWPGRLRMVSNFFFAVFAAETVSLIVGERSMYVKNISALAGIAMVCISLTYTFLNQSANQVHVDYKPTTAKQAPFTNYQVSSKTGFMYLVRGYNTGVGSLDYWPKKSVVNWNTEEKIRTHHVFLDKEEALVKYSSMPDGISYKVNNKKNCSLDLPFFNYGKHYIVRVDGKERNYFETSRGTIGVSNIAKGKHNIDVKYKQNNIENIAKIISIVTILLLLLMAAVKNIPCKKDKNIL